MKHLPPSTTLWPWRRFHCWTTRGSPACDPISTCTKFTILGFSEWIWGLDLGPTPFSATSTDICEHFVTGSCREGPRTTVKPSEMLPEATDGLTRTRFLWPAFLGG